MYGSLHNLFPYAFSDAVGAGDGAKSFESLHFVLRLSLMETAWPTSLYGCIKSRF
jgi:hypothetical protein